MHVRWCWWIKPLITFGTEKEYIDALCYFSGENISYYSFNAFSNLSFFLSLIIFPF
jgi:hypothetical protein